MKSAEGEFTAVGVLRPHLAAGYNLARWILRNEQDAEDVLQESFLRGLRHFDGFQGEQAKAWFLAIVRNAAYSWLRKNGKHSLAEPLDEERVENAQSGSDQSPEAILEQSLLAANLRQALEALPELWREVLVLRELEGLSYREISEIQDVPLGTVMSRLSRARNALIAALKATVEG